MFENREAKAKRNLIEFQIEEISAVDSPAMEGALMTIMKRDSGRRKGDEFQKRVDEVCALEGLTRVAAMRAVRQRMSQAEFDSYRAGVRLDSTFKARGQSKAEFEFQDKVREAMRHRGLSRTAAMSVVRREYPLLFQALQVAQWKDDDASRWDDDS